MKRKHMLPRNLLRTITGSLGRFAAIVSIIALGAGLFVGLLSTKNDMMATGQWYADRQNMFDLRLVNPYGWTEEDVQAVSAMPGVAQAEGAMGLDVILQRPDSENSAVYKLLSIPEQINRIELQGGRLPQSPQECLADGYRYDDSILGTVFTVTQDNADSTREALASDTYTVVGYVSTPLYMNMNRGNTNVGNGQIATYLYLMPEGFAADYYTDIYVTIPGDYTVYTDVYDDAMDAAADTLEPLLEPLAQNRLTDVRNQAEAEYAEGLSEYEQGLADYDKGKADTQKELADARKKLLDGQKEVDNNRKKLEDGQKLLEAGQEQLDANAALLASSRQALADAKSETYTQLAEAQSELMGNYKTVNSSLTQVNSGLGEIDAGLAQLDSGIAQLESGLEQIASGLEQLDTMLSILNPTIEAAQKALDYAKEQTDTPQEELEALQEKLDELIEKRDGYSSQQAELEQNQTEYTEQLEDLKSQREEVLTKRQELQQTQKTLQAAMDEINMGFRELESSQTQADNQFAANEAKLDASQLQLDQAQKELDAQKAELEAGTAQLEEAQAEIDTGWEEYESGKAEAERELADAKAELETAKAQLADAREEIDNLAEPSVYALTRNTNIGYVSLENDSDIVAGVSRVFPAFFLLVAALVCITTMTRMVNEERTQIGTFKALGYSGGAIAGKYLAYSGIAALGGCTLGVLAGSVAFPQILWQAYRIMYNISPWVQMRLDWILCLSVVTVYTALTLLATWYCCRRELREVPAQLIRPKSPTSGKKIFLEILPFWDKIGFLNKVAARNIFRYRQRLLMMLLGIGGCTALLVTGFGIRDSIVNVVDFQFEEVTVYDAAVTFRENQTEAERQGFLEELAGSVDQVRFCHQSSVELDTGDGVKSVYLLCADKSLDGFLDLHDGNQALSIPPMGQALISSGVAEAMKIRVGDSITIRDPDMQTMTLTVAGIFDNHVYNYVITPLSAVRLAWGEDYDVQTALLTVRDDQDVHAASARIMDMDTVLNVTVNQDLASQVGSMMDALDLVVLTVVICAGLLAIIVLYNLTNININERVREIATIKVLGFRAGESAAYVFKENLTLSLMGAILGLPAGKLLLDFVMTQIKLDMVWFQARVKPLSYVLAFALTMLAACLVDFVFYFRLEKINMAEALKSVE